MKTPRSGRKERNGKSDTSSPASSCWLCVGLSPLQLLYFVSQSLLVPLCPPVIYLELLKLFTFPTRLSTLLLPFSSLVSVSVLFCLLHVSSFLTRNREWRWHFTSIWGHWTEDSLLHQYFLLLHLHPPIMSRAQYRHNVGWSYGESHICSPSRRRWWSFLDRWYRRFGSHDKCRRYHCWYLVGRGTWYPYGSFQWYDFVSWTKRLKRTYADAFSSMGPCLGPLFGGWIAYRTGQWRWIYWVLFIFVGVVFLFTLIMPETLAPVLLRRKAKKLNKDNHTDSYVSKHDLHHIPLSTTLKTAMIRPFILMFMEPIILFMSFYLSFVYSLLYATFFAFPIAFEEIRGWNMGITGVSFVSIIVSCLFPIIATVVLISTRLVLQLPCSVCPYKKESTKRPVKMVKSLKLDCIPCYSVVCK